MALGATFSKLMRFVGRWQTITREKTDCQVYVDIDRPPTRGAMLAIGGTAALHRNA